MALADCVDQVRENRCRKDFLYKIQTTQKPTTTRYLKLASEHEPTAVGARNKPLNRLYNLPPRDKLGTLRACTKIRVVRLIPTQSQPETPTGRWPCARTLKDRAVAAAYLGGGVVPVDGVASDAAVAGLDDPAGPPDDIGVVSLRGFAAVTPETGPLTMGAAAQDDPAAMAGARTPFTRLPAVDACQTSIFENVAGEFGPAPKRRIIFSPSMMSYVPGLARVQVIGWPTG
jgi:hypothetical protein